MFAQGVSDCSIKAELLAELPAALIRLGDSTKLLAQQTSLHWMPAVLQPPHGLLHQVAQQISRLRRVSVKQCRGTREGAQHQIT